jgi:acyl-CoA thioester hydrolase
MYATETKIRVRYSETDRMGYCYYGNYAQFFEVARVEALRALGISYRELEDNGILLPVVDFNIQYKRPAFYDDELIIKCIVPELPQVKIIFNYQTFRNDELLNNAQTTLVFLDKESGKPMKSPENISSKFKHYFN